MQHLQWKRLGFILVVLFLLVLVVSILLSSLGIKTSHVAVSHEGSTTPGTTVQATGTRSTTPTKTGIPHVGITPTVTPFHSSNGSLSIPSVGINAPIENVGLASDGTLDVPTQQPWTDVGWYRYGPYPGSRGSAVIDGHLDRPGGSPAVFWNLKNMHVGDIVTVTNAKGQSWHFKVTGMRYYTPDSAPVSSIFGNTSGTFLNLVTCAGTWIPSIHQTTLRLVVYSTLV